MNQMIRSFTAAPGACLEGPQHVGLIRIGRAMLAIHVEFIREVIPAPATLFAAAIVAEGLCGMIELRGTVIPVADLRSTLGLETTDGRNKVVLVLRVHGRLIGLMADEVCGIAVATGEDLHSLSIAPSSVAQSLTTHSFRWSDQVVMLLSAERLIDLPGMPSVKEKLASAGLELLATAEPILLFNLEKLYFGIAAHAVDATAPNAAILDSPLKSDICLGIIDHHGTEVPVVDTLRILGLGCREKIATSSVLILRFGEKDRLGFVLDGVCDIPRLQPERILAMPSLMADESNLFRGVFSDEAERQFLILDTSKLHDHADLAALAQLSRKKGVAEQPETMAVQSGASEYRPYLTYRAGADIASPLTSIREIVDFPAVFTPIAPRADGIFGLFTHRGSAIPLICLAKRLGLRRTVDPARDRVLLVPDGDQTVGIVVECLKSIESARSRPMQKESRDDRAPTPSFIGDMFAEFRANGQIRLLPNVDLTSVFRRA